MPEQRWSRYLPDWSLLLLVVGIVLVLLMAVEFVNVTVTRSRLAAELAREEARYQRTAEQVQRLRDLLPAFQQNQHVPAQAYEDFGLVMPGTLVVVPEQPVELPVAPARSAEPADRPWLLEWLQRLPKP